MTDRLPTRRSPISRSPFRCSVLAGLAAVVALAVAGCSSLPDPADVKLLPSTNAFVPTSSADFAKSAVNTNRPVSAAELVDGQGACAGAVAASGEPGSIDRPLRGVGLDMTECEVVQIIGPAQSTQIGANERGERSVVMTYASAERSGIYRFTGGRLTAIERNGEPPPERPAKKKPPVKRANPA
ncbi:MAG: hypothetical protein HXX10_27025 [Rhodoplanes sp.]|uniref:hypothetical protein n=1 Tax=Rhodoplanes sp. TaxID=1968906 RepID=UPI0017CFF570|nr:hypothetical protein [Rhodoplanes sp.]NVO17694.1 hypothetical protein [Rhodoplanes sp.]